MAKKKVIIVGVGVSGLSAAISARFLGYEVHCLDRYNRIGGQPEAHPAVDSTPMDPELMSRWLGVRIEEPQVKQCDSLNGYAFGKLNPLSGEAMKLYNVERGHRKTAIDRYLYEIALKMGITFEFGHTVTSQKDLNELPTNTILCTGPYREIFDSLNKPYEWAYGYIATRRVPSERVYTAAYFDYYTKDYAYIAQSNGVVFALFFARVPVGKEHIDTWAAQLKETEGIEFKKWDLNQGTFASKYPGSYELFRSNKILAGTLAGAQDPGTYFGVHGGLVSGKIAAIALENKGAAQDLFNICNRTYNVMWVMRRLAINYSPDFLRKIGLSIGLGKVQSSPLLQKMAGLQLAINIPGWTLLKRHIDRYPQFNQERILSLEDF